MLNLPNDEETDASLLREFIAHREEAAFRALVDRHLPGVWSAARRILNGDAALAEDIAQEVFAHLAVHASKLPPRVVLGGWLHRHTCFTATKAVRAASRRRAREQQAAAMILPDSPDPWPELAPHLDAALNSLSTTDRDALVLRFFEKQNFRSIAIALDTTEVAARIKTTRALEKLRGILGRKRAGVLTVALLASLLNDRARAAPPASLAGAIVKTSLSATATTAGMSLLARVSLRTVAVGTLAVLAITAVSIAAWHTWSAQATKASTVGSHLGNLQPAKEPQGVKARITVHFLRLAAADALGILNQRWNGDADGEILDSLLQSANQQKDRVQLIKEATLVLRSGQRGKFEDNKEFPYPTEFEHTSGVSAPMSFEARNVGTQFELDPVLRDDGTGGDITVATAHDFTEPVMHHFSNSLTKQDSASAAVPEFRVAKGSASFSFNFGEPLLIHGSQLPPCANASPHLPVPYIFVFLTVQTEL